MKGLLPSSYSNVLKREKLILRVFSVFIFGVFIFLSGIIFLLPSYFTLVFSLNDVLRNLSTEEISLKRKDVEGLEGKTSYINSLLDSYFDGESKRKSFSNLLLSLTNFVSDEIKLTSIQFQKDASEGFVFHIRGEAADRSALILYSQKLRQLEQIKELRSPVSNLLQEKNIKFLLEAVINQKHYEYKN